MARFEYRFFHPAVIRSLMSRVGREAGDVAEYWKYGLWFKDGKRDSQLLVQCEDTSTADAPGAGELVLKAQGRDPAGLLREIRKAIKRIGEEPTELFTWAGVTVARSALASMMDGRVLDVHGRPVHAAPFSAFFEDREVMPDSKIDIKPEPLKAGEKRREVFISYAWGDDSPEGQIRAKVVDGLYESLQKDGFEPVRDRNAMKSGDLISAFMRRLTRADLVVAVISDKYLRSPYCMFEIYKLWQKNEAGAELMAGHLVPMILPDVRIGSFEDRLPYLKYWGERAEKLEALIRNPAVSPSSECWDEVRLVREFAHHLDGILVFLQDVLMPRQLEAHLDKGFEAVRAALRRRMEEG